MAKHFSFPVSNCISWSLSKLQKIRLHLNAYINSQINRSSEFINHKNPNRKTNCVISDTTWVFLKHTCRAFNLACKEVRSGDFIIQLLPIVVFAISECSHIENGTIAPQLGAENLFIRSYPYPPTELWRRLINVIKIPVYELRYRQQLEEIFDFKVDDDKVLTSKT